MRRANVQGLQLACLFGCLGLACNGQKSEHAPAKAETKTLAASATSSVSPMEVLERAKPVFGTLPKQADNPNNPLTEEKIALGRMLYYDKRLSKNHDVSCDSCHPLAQYGADARKNSEGHKKQVGERNSPTVYNAAFHFTQFWDGRAADVEEQAKGPILNPVEMAMPDAEHVLAVLRTIPGYEAAFRAAFPGEKQPIDIDNLAKAIAAFERKLVTPAPFDAFLAGNVNALSASALRGLQAFMNIGCIQCHTGSLLGGNMFQKLGTVKPYETHDTGRFKVTNSDADKFVFKVPSLRNVARTGPYFHDGSVATLDEAVQIMAEHQTAKGKLGADELAAILAFFDSLTGEIPKDYIAQPELPPGGPKTPKPDPT